MASEKWILYMKGKLTTGKVKSSRFNRVVFLSSFVVDFNRKVEGQGKKQAFECQ